MDIPCNTFFTLIEVLLYIPRYFSARYVVPVLLDSKIFHMLRTSVVLAAAAVPVPHGARHVYVVVPSTHDGAPQPHQPPILEWAQIGVPRMTHYDGHSGVRRHPGYSDLGPL